MKKPLRLLLLGAAALAVLLVAAAAVALNSRVQTWAARRALASRPALHATLGSVSADLGHVELKGLRVEANGAVLTLPTLTAELPLISAGASSKILITRLVAKGWTLDLSKARPSAGAAGGAAPGRSAASFALLSSARAADPAVTAVAQLFQGIFSQLQLPVDLALDGVELAGDVILPSRGGSAKLTLTGGGLAAGREGRFALSLDASTTGLNSLAVRATLLAAMDTPRTFTRLAVRADVAASGLQFPQGVKLAADLSATRAAAGENYSLTLATVDKQLLAVQAAFPGRAVRLAGTWKLDVHTADLAPFTLGRTLPAFAAAGEGRFDTDAAFAAVHAVGRLNATVDHLAVIQPELASLGAVRLVADFDLAQHRDAKLGDTLRVERLTAALSGSQPFATVQSLQAFDFNPQTRELKAADPARELLSLTLQGVPLAWAQPLLKNFSLTGGDLRGELAATARDGGFALRAKAPLTATGVSLAQAGQPLLRTVDLSLGLTADYTPQGWQAELAPLTVASGGTTFFTLEARAGQLAGKNQPIKSAGKFSCQLPAVLAQPIARGAVLLTTGDATGEFIVSLEAQQSIQAKLGFANLVADPKLTTEKLPTLNVEVRADIAAGGQITFNAPLLIERGGRKSDLTIGGTVTPAPAGFVVDARVTSARLVVDDAKILAAPLAAAPHATPSTVPSPAAAKPTAPGSAPPWAGVSGQIALALKQVVISDTFQTSDVTGTVRLTAGALQLDGFRAGLGAGSEAKLTGGLNFEAKSATPYALTADLAVNDFDPAPLFLALQPGQPATVEGKFTVVSTLSGRAVTMADLANAAHGDFRLSSKSGVFRGLPVSASSKVEGTGRLAGGIAFLGNLAGAVTGRKEYSDIANKAQAVAAVAKFWQAIPYDQLSVVLTRDAALNTVLKDFSLISPEVRLAGSGRATHAAGAPLLDEALAMEFKLRARGHHGDLLKYLGALDAQPDELGYAGCTLPLRVKGTLGQPDTSELNHALATLALEKTGASDLFNKLLGGGK